MRNDRPVPKIRNFVPVKQRCKENLKTPQSITEVNILYLYAPHNTNFINFA